MVYRNDRIYVSSSSPSYTRGHSRTTLPYHAGAPAENPPLHAVRPTPQSLSPTQALPPSNNLARARFLTPPPTPAVPRPSPTRSTAVGHSIPVPAPPHEEDLSYELTESAYHPVPIVTEPQRKHYTNIRPLLREEQMSHYFQTSDGIANRPSKGMSRSLSLR